MKFDMKWKAGDVEAKVTAAAAEGLKELVAMIREESQRICPKDRGYKGGLVSTWYEEIDESLLSAKFGYKAPHAHLQHEKTYYKHKPGEQAKFLETPIDRIAQNVVPHVGARIKRTLT